MWKSRWPSHLCSGPWPSVLRNGSRFGFSFQPRWAKDNSNRLQFSQEPQRDWRYLPIKLPPFFRPVICSIPLGPWMRCCRTETKQVYSLSQSVLGFLSLSFCFTGRHRRQRKAISCLSLLSGTVFTCPKCYEGLLVIVGMGNWKGKLNC